jgi:endoribonuclease Dicer
VSNAQQALRAIDMELFKWIIRDHFASRKWKPAMRVEKAASHDATVTTTAEAGKRNEPRKKTQELSTKLLADVVEACIGAAMLTGGWDLAVDCVKLFGLGISDWRSVPASVQMVLERTETLVDFPSQTTDVERIIGYTFQRKAFLVEAITHSSSQAPYRTTSYERMEFLGDAVRALVWRIWTFY